MVRATKVVMVEHTREVDMVAIRTMPMLVLEPDMVVLGTVDQAVKEAMATDKAVKAHLQKSKPQHTVLRSR